MNLIWTIETILSQRMWSYRMSTGVQIMTHRDNRNVSSDPTESEWINSHHLEWKPAIPDKFCNYLQMVDRGARKWLSTKEGLINPMQAPELQGNTNSVCLWVFEIKSNWKKNRDSLTINGVEKVNYLLSLVWNICMHAPCVHRSIQQNTEYTSIKKSPYLGNSIFPRISKCDFFITLLMLM